MAMALASGGEASSNMADDDEPLVTILPQEVIDALAELDLELSEGRVLHYFMANSHFVCLGQGSSNY